jgi:hypothetical protein
MNAFAHPTGEAGVERGGELHVSVADQELEAADTVFDGQVYRWVV